ncbi:MAG: cytochrome c1, partial [Candidatus Gracilibacteria bacterium]
VKAYMGATPPDLSQYIKSRKEHYLHGFINDPQVLLAGTSMPRVGLNEKAQEDVIAYMEEIGDSKKAERESLGLWVMLYTFVFAILAYLWKRKIWSEVH